MKIVLILMVKNEERILKRCLEAVEHVVDAFCIHDTGSTDKTVQIAEEFLETHKGCVTVSKWKNFGYNRTRSFREAQVYVHKGLNWDLKDTYGLLLDADMVFVPGTLRDQPLDGPGYTMVQLNGSLEYSNTRLVRMDYSWNCKGVTHEYWDGPTTNLPKSVCYIDDRNDGGCKSDKFERDARLLEQGLKDEPGNVRYLFYLGQTYNCLQRYKESIQMYKKRIGAGGWDEEVWYSHYMIGENYHRLGNIPKFEEWMLRAHAFRPSRAEALYKLAKHFRESAKHYKAYQYVEEGTRIPYPPDVLFVERPVYEGLFEYERTILDYYVKDPAHGLRTSVLYLLRSGVHMQNVLSNLVFYVKPIGTTRALSLPKAFGDEYRTSAVSIGTYPCVNVRYVNYWIENGEYKTPPGEPVRTQNAYVNLETGEVLAKMNDASVSLPRREVHVLGLEDVRLYDDKFTATVQEYSPGVSVLQGTYDWKTGTYKDCQVLPSPSGRSCEKNWLPIPGTSSFLYDWHPLRVIGETESTHSTPPLFSLFRGSAPPIRVKDELWALVHFVEYSKPRKYYHCFVALEPGTYKPKAVTLPFVFRSASIEYCVSTRLASETEIECYVSFQDKDSSVTTIPIASLQWVNLDGQLRAQ
jgi:glycosyltransferase involved in cell wall biosynthesis